ncbi:MAG: sugar phosphate isomerase/epimerase [Parasporobacterium sp.]|nr:sugar phosphate isomerase/epimerase [Parasporobacterium sp.]
MMKVGLYSISCSGVWFHDRPALTVEEFIDTAVKYGYEGVEIDLKRPHGSPLDLDVKRCRQIREYAKQQGLPVCAVSANNNFAMPIPETVENELLMVREQIRVAKELGAPVLRLFAAWRGIVMRDGIATYEITRNPDYLGMLKYQQFQQILACFRECAKWAEDAGVVLALQNHAPVINTYMDMLEFVRLVDSPNFKCCLDAPCLGWNATVQSDEYIRKAVRDVGALQVLSHANAEFAETQDGSVEMISFDTQEQPVLTNYPMFIRTLREIGYDGFINYEFCHMPFHDGRVLGYQDYIDNQIRLARIYFKNLIDQE